MDILESGFIKLEGFYDEIEVSVLGTGCYACQSCQCNTKDPCQKCQSCQSCNINC